MSLTNFPGKASLSPLRSHLPPPLPPKTIIGYANWGQCDEKILKAVEEGVNVVIWFSVDLTISSEGKPVVARGPDMDCVARIVASIKALFPDVIHLISIGGWNSPHPDTSLPPEVVYESWKDWNCNFAARPLLGFNGFDGIDWDVEGNDTPSSPYNQFSVGIALYILYLKMKITSTLVSLLSY